MKIELILNGEKLERRDNKKLIQNSRNINFAIFNISGELYKQEIFAIFESNDGKKTIKYIGNKIGKYEVKIPNHCTTGKSFKVAIYSDDLIISNFVTIHNKTSLYEDGLKEEIVEDNKTLIDEIFDILHTKADKGDTYSKLDIIGLLADFYTMQEVDGLIDAIIQEVDDISEISNNGIYIIDDRVYVYNDGTLYDIMADEVVDVVENGNMSAVTSNAVYDALGDKQDVGNMVQTIASHSSTDKYPSAKAVYDTLSGKEDISNKVANWSDSPTDENYPSEKLVKDSLDGKLNIAMPEPGVQFEINSDKILIVDHSDSDKIKKTGSLPVYLMYDVNAHPNIGTPIGDSQQNINNHINYALGDKLNKLQENHKGKNVVVDSTTGYITFEEKPDISEKEDKSNKVTSWSNPPLDTNYPSEKLVREYLDDAIYDLEDKIGSEGLQIKDFGNGIVLYYNDLERYLFVDTTVTVSNVAQHTDTPIGNIPSRFAPPVTATNIDETHDYYIHIFSDGTVKFKNIKSAIDGTVAVKGMVQWLNVAKMEQVESSNGITLYELDGLRCLTVNYDNLQGENYITISNAISQDAPEIQQIGYAHNGESSYMQINSNKNLHLYRAYHSNVEGMLFWYDTSDMDSIRIPSTNWKFILFYDDDVRILRPNNDYMNDGDTFTIPSEYAPPIDISAPIRIEREFSPYRELNAEIGTDGGITINSSSSNIELITQTQIIWFKEKPTGIYSYIQSIINNTP